MIRPKPANIHVRLISIAVILLIAEIQLHGQNKLGLYGECARSFAVFGVEDGDVPDERMSPLLSLNFGIEYERSISEEIAIVCGVGYGRMGFDFDHYSIPASFHYSRSFLKIPLMIRFHVVDHRKFGLGIAAGITNNFLFRSTVESFDYHAPAPGNESYFPDPSTVEYERAGFKQVHRSGFRVYNIGLAANLALSYVVSSKVSLAFGPTAEYFLTSTKGDTDEVKERFYNYGARLTASYCFPKIENK
jgi:hypothetical protein